MLDIPVAHRLRILQHQRGDVGEQRLLAGGVLALFAGSAPTETSCTRCGSTDYQSRGTQVALTGTYQRFQCLSCGGWFRAVRRDSGSDVTGV